jgi:hypothetical protein
MSGETTARPVWVNGVRHDGAKAAAERVSLLFGWKVRAAWIEGVIRTLGNIETCGVTISGDPPEGALQEGEPVPARAVRKPSRQPLLRYPKGAAPPCRGPGHATR